MNPSLMVLKIYIQIQIKTHKIEVDDLVIAEATAGSMYYSIRDWIVYLLSL